eukprot:366545-Chlamydomonas_euryale.AAC.4
MGASDCRRWHAANPHAERPAIHGGPCSVRRQSTIRAVSIACLRFKKREPIGFLATIRPDTQTMSQTMRMMGTYHTDYEYAAAFGINIPHMSPGGPRQELGYHPDTVGGGDS